MASSSFEKLPFAKTFRELLVYQKAFQLSLEVHTVSMTFPREEQFKGIADQMRRASKGICATIAEGYAKTAYPAEWRRFLLMGLGSAQEMQVWADYAVKLNYISEETALRWDGCYEEIGRMLQGMIQKAGK